MLLIIHVMWQSVSSKSLDHEKIVRKWGLASDDKEIGAKVSLVRDIHALMNIMNVAYKFTI